MGGKLFHALDYTRHQVYYRLFAVILILLAISNPTVSQAEDLQNRLLSYLTNPVFSTPRESIIEYIESSSVLAVSNDDAHPPQTSSALNVTAPVFRFNQTRLHDNISRVTEGYDMRFSVTGGGGGQNQTAWMRLPKNVTLNETGLSVSGLMSSSTGQVQSKVLSVAVGELTGAFANDEVIAGTDDGHVYVISSSGIIVSPLTKTLGYPVYAVGSGDISTRTRNDYVVGSSNGTVYAFMDTGALIWNYSTGNYPVYAVAVGNVTGGAHDDVVLGTWNRRVIALNSSGEQVWNYTVGSEIHDIAIGDVTANEGNEVVVGSYDGFVYVLDKTGSLVWSYDAGNWVMGVAVGDFNSSSPGNEVIYTSNDFSVYVLNSDGNRVLFSYETQSYVQSAAVGDVLQDGGNELVVGSWDKGAYVVNSSGSWVTNRTTQGFVYDVAIGDVFTEDGLEVVVASGDGSVYMMNFRFFTKNPYLDIASSGLPYEWSYTGLFQGTEAVNQSFINITQAVLNNCNTTMCDVPFMGHSEESGVLNIRPWVSFTYNASRHVNYTYVGGFSKTENIRVNEVIGTLLLKIMYLSRPELNISINYIAAGGGARECDFDGADFNVTTDGENHSVCDISSVGRVLTSNPLVDLPETDTYWDDSMSSVVVAQMIESTPDVGVGSWRKNITIINGTSVTFNNIIAETTVNDSLFNQELRVDWFDNDTFYDLTPAVLRADCKTSTPTYSALTVGPDVFYVCKQDTDGDQIVDYFKWIQPYINKTTKYYTASYFDYAPVLSNVNVTPQEAPWGTVFNYTADVFDQENQNVEVILFVKLGAQDYLEEGTMNVSGTGTVSFSLTSNASWIGTNNSFYFKYTDYTHPWYYTNNYSLPRVTGHTSTFENIIGNNSAIARKGINSTMLAATIRDTQLDAVVGPGVNCSFIVMRDGVWAAPYETTTDSNGQCSYGFDPNQFYEPGYRRWRVQVSGNTAYMDMNSTDYYVNITGEANMTLPSRNQKYVRNFPIDLTAKIVDEFDQDAGLGGLTCRWYINGVFRGTSQTNNTGYCLRTEPTDCVTWQLGNYSVNVTLDYSGSSFWTVLSNSTREPVYLTDSVSISLDTPQNNSVHHKGDTINLSSTISPMGCPYAPDPNQLAWYVDGFQVATAKDANWSIPSTMNVGPRNITVNATGNYTSTPVYTTINIWGYASVDSITPSVGNYIRGTPVTFTCRVVDSNLSIGLENYTVYFYKDDSFMYANQTDSLGEATWDWNTSNETEKTYNITCIIQDASNIYYNASDQNRKEASVTVTYRMGVLNITVDNSSIYRSDALSPNAASITAMVGKGAAFPTENATLHFYLPEGIYKNCTTDAAGYCSVAYNPSDNITPGNYTIYLNATKTGELSSFLYQTYLQVKGRLGLTLDSPSAGDVVHRGDPTWLYSTVLDEYGSTVPNTVIRWNDSLVLIGVGEDVLWSVMSNQTLGNTTVHVSVMKDNYDPSYANVSIFVWGWLHPEWVSPKYEMSYGVSTYLVCNVSDSNTSGAIGNYLVDFYYNNTLIGSNYTISNGEARLLFTATDEATHVFKCGVNHSAAIFYNASSLFSDEQIVLVYPLRTFSGYVLNAIGRPTNTTFRLYSEGTNEVIREFATDENGGYDVYVHNKTSDLGMTLNEINAQVRINSVNFSAIVDDPIDFDLVSGTETTLINDVRGFAVNTTYFTGPAQITINYSESDVVESEDYLSIYYCYSWDYGNRKCLGEWIQLKDSVVNKPLNFVSVNVTNLTTVGKTAYMIAENLPSERPPKIGFINATPQNIEPSGNITLFVSVSDTDLDEVNASLGSLNVTLSYNATTGLFEYFNLTAPAAEGEYTLTVTVSDLSGNTVSDSETRIWVDGSNPIIRLVSPAAGSQIRAGTLIELSVTDATLDAVWYAVDGSANTTITQPFKVDSTGWSEGLRTLTVWARDRVGRLESKSFTFIVNNTIVAFTLSNVGAKSIQLGETTLIEVNVSSGSPVTSVSVQITDPAGNTANYSMTNDSSKHYLTTISGLTERGDYIATVTARDSQGNSISKTGWFEVYTLREFYGDVLDAMNRPVRARFRFIRPNATDVIEEFSTDANGEYNTRIRNRTSDIEVTAFNSVILLEDVNLATLPNDPIDVDYVEGSDMYVPGTKPVKGLAVDLANSFSGKITLTYSEGDFSLENESSIYECLSWEYVTRLCNSGWTALNAAENRVENNISSNVTAFTAYALTEQLRCGNGVCESEFGENCFVCEQDCGSCDIAANVTVQARRPPSVDLEPLESELNEQQKLLEELKKELEAFKEGVNLSALETRIRDQFLTVEDIATILSMSRRAQALVPGLQIVSAELYPGETIRTTIHVKNVLENTSLVELNVTGRIGNFITFETPIIELPGYEEADVSIIVFIPLDTPPGAYYGELKIISGDVVANIPVNLRVLESRERILDLKIQPLSDEVSPGDQVRVEVSIYNLGGRARVDSHLTLQVVDIVTNDPLVEIYDNITVERTVSVVKALNMSRDIPEGRYVVRGIVSYVDLGGNLQYVSAVGYVTVKKSFFQLTFFGVPVWLILFTAFTLTAVYIVYFIRKRQIERRRRYLEAVTLKALPQPGPRAGFVGRIAETNIRAFIEIDKG